MMAQFKHCLGILALTTAALVPTGCNKGKKNTPDAQETGVPPNAGGPPGPANSGSSGLATAGGAVRSAPVDPNVYGYSFGESTVASDSAPRSAPLRARRFDTCFKLSNARKDTYKTGPGVNGGAGMGAGPVFGPPPAPGAPILVVDYQAASENAFTRFLWLVMRTSDGQDAPVWLGELEQRAGSITLVVSDAPWARGPGPGPGNNALPQNVEMYLIRKENRYGKDVERSFKVSNSVFLGQSRFQATPARDWTSQEAAVFANLPIEPPKPGLNPGLGEDTPFAGKPAQKGPRPNRIVDPVQPLIGVDVRIGSFPIKGGKEDCLSLLVPIYDRAYPDMGLTRILAKPGYAVGAVLAKSNNFVNAVQVTFMKLKADNSGLDPKDSYTSAWVGPQQAGVKEIKLGGDGRKVIGVHCNQAAVLDGFALVMDSNR